MIHEKDLNPGIVIGESGLHRILISSRANENGTLRKHAKSTANFSDVQHML